MQWARQSLSRSSHLPPTIDPSAHAAFLAWAKEHGFTQVKPAGMPTEDYTWSLLDSSPREYLYKLHYPVEGSRIIQVLSHEGTWKAEEVHWQFSVGKSTWQEIAPRLAQRADLQGAHLQVLLEGPDFVVITFVRLADSPARSVFFYRLSKGADGLWRGYDTYDPAVRYTADLYRLPEDALIAFALKNFPGRPILGACVDARPGQDEGKVCWRLDEARKKQNFYEIGLTFQKGEKIELDEYAPGWYAGANENFPTR